MKKSTVFFIAILVGAIFIYFWSHKKRSKLLIPSSPTTAMNERQPKDLDSSKRMKVPPPNSEHYSEGSYKDEQVDHLEVGSSEDQVGVLLENEYHGPGAIRGIDEDHYIISDLINNSFLLRDTRNDTSTRIPIPQDWHILGFYFDSRLQELMILIRDQSSSSSTIHLSNLSIEELKSSDPILLEKGTPLQNVPKDLIHYSGTVEMGSYDDVILLSFFHHHYSLDEEGILKILPGFPINQDEFLAILHTPFEKTQLKLVSRDFRTVKQFSQQFPYESLKSYKVIEDLIYLEFDHFIPPHENNGESLQVVAIEVLNLEGERVREYTNERKNYYQIDRDLYVAHDGTLWQLQAKPKGFDILKMKAL